MKYFLSEFPGLDKIAAEMQGVTVPDFRDVNGHIHTPFSFSAFSSMNSIFEMAGGESISVLGINDFNVASGYQDFHAGCLEHRIFPLFNIEFIGLMEEEQKKGIRINDPNNPGRVYFSGKGLDFPFEPGFFMRRQLRSVIDESQSQVKSMIDKLNSLIPEKHSALKLTYETVKREYTSGLVRERHIAKALRIAASGNFSSDDEIRVFLESLYGGKKSSADYSKPASLENEIRNNILKSGGTAFVPENGKSFLSLKKIIRIITSAGGIPCYPVLLDDPAGKFTEFEGNFERLHDSLRKLGVECIELIPGRNDINILTEFVRFFDERDFIITFGTEHNTPEMIPLSVTARGSAILDSYLKEVAWEGACVIAAHQYLRAVGRQGYVLPDGRHSASQKKDLVHLGRMIIEYYLNKYGNES
ncbi:MAG: hypothetical protein MUE32_07565 [Bacteroidales bacterium]|jgi:hypothetical protein|nr:hypothetical protein [Bacteroidales bacterium]